ncbi:hypothetical protein DEO72_LG8g2050 [Vigna unguiculata]|uniref:Uncharacterized protein n=1 Tax=Vigna unguiculata TaxID=3917 RepID=A0A4D6MSG3_VIGUN|nr:hypothetical protein DEO72_LG8g2050 [Vigna unguiculata]
MANGNPTKGTTSSFQKGLLITSNGEVKEIDATFLKEKFVWAAQPVYKHEEVLEEQWKDVKSYYSSMLEVFEKRWVCCNVAETF